jgi:hypothetical protein
VAEAATLQAAAVQKAAEEALQKANEEAQHQANEDKLQVAEAARLQAAALQKANEDTLQKVTEEAQDLAISNEETFPMLTSEDDHQEQYDRNELPMCGDSSLPKTDKNPQDLIAGCHENEEKPNPPPSAKVAIKRKRAKARIRIGEGTKGSPPRIGS